MFLFCGEKNNYQANILSHVPSFLSQFISTNHRFWNDDNLNLQFRQLDHQFLLVLAFNQCLFLGFFKHIEKRFLELFGCCISFLESFQMIKYHSKSPSTFSYCSQSLKLFRNLEDSLLFILNSKKELLVQIMHE